MGSEIKPKGRIEPALERVDTMDKQTEQIVIRLTKEERQNLEREAKIFKVTLSDIIRSRLFPK